MVGIHFFHNDCGQGGKDGFVCTTDKWCVETSQGKRHITKTVTDQTKFTVVGCDGSCVRQKEDLPIDILQIVWEIERVAS